MLSSYGRNEWLTILASGLMLAVAIVVADAIGMPVPWWLAIPVGLLALALVTFFRDPHRPRPTQRNVMVAPADGKVSSVHELEHFEPLGGPATCIRIFLSVFDVHVNRSPCHGEVTSITHKPGKHLSALNPESAEVNESNLIVLRHPIREHPVAAVRQVAGAVARTIACGVREGQVLQRAQRIGMIKLGSTTELYIPAAMRPQPQVREGQKVRGGVTVLAHITAPDTGATRETPAGEIAAHAKADAAS